MADHGSMLGLSGLSGLDMLDGNPLFFCPFQQLATDVFGAIVNTNGAGLSTPFNDAVQAPDDPLGGQGKVDLDAQSFTVEVVQHVQQPELAAVTQTVGHEGKRPA